MKAGKKMKNFTPYQYPPSSPNKLFNASGFRNLKKGQLGGVIFGCKNDTIKECLLKQLFGLPFQHFSYVKNIVPGLPLFLFNYSDRKLNGIFEAAGTGQLNINPYAWTSNVRVRLQCQPLLEDQFKPIILDNYYCQNLFWFELDHAQTSNLISRLSSQVIGPSSISPWNATSRMNIFNGLPSNDMREKTGYFKLPGPENGFANSCESTGALVTKDSLHLNGDNQKGEVSGGTLAEPGEKDLMYMKLKELAINLACSGAPVTGQAVESAALMESDSRYEAVEHDTSQEPNAVLEDLDEKNDKSSVDSTSYPSVIAQLVQGMDEFKAFKETHKLKVDCLEKKLAEAEKEIQQLKSRCVKLELVSNPLIIHADETMSQTVGLDLVTEESIYLVGGYDGETWLSALDLYSPSPNVIKSLQPMNSARSYTSVTKLNGELYALGGGTGCVWYDTVESYDPAKNLWTSHPSLKAKKGSMASATLNDKIFAIGGGNGHDCLSDVEMYDLQVGRWIPTRSMQKKRFALAGAELNGALYAVGGYDGSIYLKSAERFDPREHSWTKIKSMNTERGCHALVAMDGKLYALGGYDGSAMVSSTEVYDPRLGEWMTTEPMKHCRGYLAAAAINDTIFVIGGVKSGEDIADTCGIIDLEDETLSGNGEFVLHNCANGGDELPLNLSSDASHGHNLSQSCCLFAASKSYVCRSFQDDHHKLYTTNYLC
nr:kelch-like protein 3 [Ipomoea batatas]